MTVISCLTMARVGPGQDIEMRDAAGPPDNPNGSRQSLHYNETAVTAENVGAVPPMNVISKEVKWIKKNIRKRQCRLIVEKTPKTDQLPPLRTQYNRAQIETWVVGSGDALCQCGYRKSSHPHTRPHDGFPPDVWNVDANTYSLPTDTFGEVEFVGYGQTERKYVRVDVKTKTNDMLKLMMDIWGLDKPNLLISVTGGAKNFHMKARLKEVFRRGLMKVAKSTGAWIITGGTNTGVMKHVGESVRDYGLTSVSSTPVVAIGIATWGVIQNKQELISKDGNGKWPARYRIEKESKVRESSLDPNHTHFILVDNGTQHDFGVEIPFRAQLEQTVANMKTDTSKDAVSVPIVLLVLQGGPNTLQTVKQAVANNTPIVVVEGSGKAADILAYAYNNSGEEEIEVTDQDGNILTQMRTVFDDALSAEVQEMVQEAYGTKNLVNNCGVVKDCLEKRDLINVFKLGTSIGSQKDIDVPILHALLKANKGQDFHQLRLALAWNRIDIAKSEIFTDDKLWPSGSLDEIMLLAINLNRVDFVEMFLDNGVSLKEFLTVKVLLQLYNSVQKNSMLYTLLQKMKKKSGNKEKYVGLTEVGMLLQYLLGDFYIPIYLKEAYFSRIDTELELDGWSSRPPPEPNFKDGMLGAALVMGNAMAGPVEQYRQDFENPYQELFTWAVLQNRQDMAKLFWKQGKEPTSAALVAFGLMTAMARKTDDCELAKKLHVNADEFCLLSVNVLNECYELDEHKAQDLLVRELDHWGSATCVLIAVETDNKHFISQTACQSLLNSVWMGKLSPDNGTISMLTCVLCPPMLFLLMKYKEIENPDTVPTNTNYNQFETQPKDGDRVQLVRRQTQHGLSRAQTMLNIKTQDMAKGEAEASNRNKPLKYNPVQKIYLFYSSPVIIFVHNVLSYLLFLGLFSYVLLIKMAKTVSVQEIILMVWVFSIFAEEIRQSVKTVMSSASKTFQTKLQSYITDKWNVVDVFTILLFVCGMILRFLPYDSTLEVARVVLALNLITFFFRILHIFSVHKELGPKLVMIARMFFDLLYFVIILMVFVVAYAIAAYSILYPNSELSFDLAIAVLRTAYWNLYGELFLDELERKEPECTFNSLLYSNDTLPRCPTQVGSFVVPWLMGLYVLFSNILLLNLLIAMFSYTFELTQLETDSIWKSLRFQTISEYCERPSLPAPLILISHLFLLLKFCCLRCCRPQDRERGFIKKIPNEREIIQWENVIADAYLTRKELAEAENIDNRINIMHHRMEVLMSKVEDIQDEQQNMTAIQHTSNAAVAPAVAPRPQPSQQTITAKMPPQLERRIVSLEDQMSVTCKALSWIVQSLQENDMSANRAPPNLPELQTHGEIEKKKRKRNEDLALTNIEKKRELHYRSRSSPYSGSNVTRFFVPDELVFWETPFPEYSPVKYLSPEVKANPYWADKEDLIELPPNKRDGKIKFNTFDYVCKVDRTSHLGDYKIVDGLPQNPFGRTGIIGRGLLGRWGPNHAGDPIVTRWKRDNKGQIIKSGGKPLLEFVSIQRTDNQLWSLPGGMCEPGQQIHECLKAEFSEEALGSLITNEDHKKELNAKLDMMFKIGKEVWRGYADDPRNTDNAWLETLVFHYHDDDGSILNNFTLRAGETVEKATWSTASSALQLHGAHLFYLKKVVEKLQAAF
ncbi:transient receptor potential cation channel subfamily M member-like 2 isoform X2 [Pecten maximus]|uniref:transient receptor potential cation channel subfamily M member-like 2 isoform X2 n=1 Tax=Pecten maximus TaxID=6579 RepID=UPI001458EB45|nr:transient receptor potential cation channel subfamily M member-like 2 isoform X2 [Pecten maximus]